MRTSHTKSLASAPLASRSRTSYWMQPRPWKIDRVTIHDDEHLLADVHP